jgi:lysophospholipid acyltransferase (LPLAT)-like uncharacterized protein
VLIRLLAVLAIIFLRFLKVTWRVSISGYCVSSVKKPVVFCFWHGDQAGLFAYPRRSRVAVLSSLSRDGELQALILKGLGFEVFRGSSSRGGAAGLKGLIEFLKKGGDVAIAADGPRGPFRVAKKGAIRAAEKSGALLVPIFAESFGFWLFKKSWDQYTLPKPFSCLTIKVGAPIDPKECTPEYLTDSINRLYL